METIFYFIFSFFFPFLSVNNSVNGIDFQSNPNYALPQLKPHNLSVSDISLRVFYNADSGFFQLFSGCLLTDGRPIRDMYVQ